MRPDPSATRRRLACAPLVRVLAAMLLLILAAVVGTPVASAADTEGAPWWHRADDGSPVVDLWVGYSSTCPHCAAARPRVEAMDAELDWLEVHWLRVDGEGVAAQVEMLQRLAAQTGEQVTGVPALLAAGRLVTGWDGTRSEPALRALLVAYHASLVDALGPGATPSPTLPPDTLVSIPGVGELDATTISLPLLAITLGGLDAVNPCALSVLLFLMSVLAGTRDRRRMLVIGGAFVAVSGLVYLALMAAWLNAFEAFGSLRIVTIIAGAAAVAAALINLKDHLGVAAGPSLVIPRAARPAIFTRLMNLSEASAMRILIPATILVAAVVNLYEMLCTGGFPVVFTRVLTLHELSQLASYAYLVLYCSVYVLPALAIVLLFTVTLGSRGVTVDEARNLKLLSGLLMLGFGLLLLLEPDLLTDLGATIVLLGGAVIAWLTVLLLERSIRRRRHRPGGPLPHRGRA